MSRVGDVKRALSRIEDLKEYATVQAGWYPTEDGTIKERYEFWIIKEGETSSEN